MKIGAIQEDGGTLMNRHSWLLCLGLFFTDSLWAEEPKEDPKSMELPCAVGDPQFGQIPCTDFKTEVINQINAKTSHLMGYFYDGALIEFISQGKNHPGMCIAQKFSGPVCEIASNEFNHTVRAETNEKQCGKQGKNNGYCDFKPGKGFQYNTCGKEKAWVKGYRISMWEKARLSVVDEIKNGTLHLVDFEGTRPCAQNAINIHTMLKGNKDKKDYPGLEFFQAELHKLYKPAMALLKTEASLLCLGNAANEAEAQEKIKKYYIKNKIDGGDLARETKKVSLAACNLAMTHREVQAAFSKLAFCEIEKRTHKEYYEKITNSEAYFERYLKELIEPCMSFAKSKFNAVKCKQDCTHKHFNQCYQGKVTAFHQEFGKATIGNIAATSFEKLKNDKGKKIPISEIPLCTALFFFAPNDRKRKPKTRKRMPLFFLLFIFLLSSCGDDDTPGLSDVVCNLNGEVIGQCTSDDLKAYRECAKGLIKKHCSPQLNEGNPFPEDNSEHEENAGHQMKNILDMLPPGNYGSALDPETKSEDQTPSLKSYSSSAIASEAKDFGNASGSNKNLSDQFDPISLSPPAPSSQRVGAGTPNQADQSLWDDDFFSEENAAETALSAKKEGTEGKNKDGRSVATLGDEGLFKKSLNTIQESRSIASDASGNQKNTEELNDFGLNTNTGISLFQIVHERYQKWSSAAISNNHEL